MVTTTNIRTLPEQSSPTKESLNGFTHGEAPFASTNGHQRELLPNPADLVPGPKQGEWTYETYAAIPEDGQRYEVLEGVLSLMAAPNWDHQGIVTQLAYYLRGFTKATNLGKVRVAPIDVELSKNTVFQPDALVLLNEHLDRVIKRHVVGAPDLVVEIASPSTVARDRNEKRVAYAHARVPEYWLIDPEERTIEVLALENGNYTALGTFRGSETLPSRILPAFPVMVEQFFEDM